MGQGPKDDMADPLTKDHDLAMPKSEIFFRHFTVAEKPIFAFIVMMVHSRTVAEDLFQETASLMWEQFDDYRPDKSFVAWGVAIARYKILEYFKRESSRKRLFKDVIYSKIEKVTASLKEDAPERLEALKSCLEKMNTSDRKLLALHYEQNLKIAEIAESLNRSKEGLYKTMSRIHAILFQCVHRYLAQVERS